MKRMLSILLLFFTITAMYGQRVYTFATVTDAARASYIGIGSTVLTEGYHSSGDGGGAHYKMMAIADAPMAVDSGYVYPVTATKVLVQVLKDEFIKTATYGVVCASSAQATNNFNRLQRFFNAIDTLDKQAFVNGCNDTIYVAFSSALTVNLASHDKFVMQGEGSDVTRIKASSGTLAFTFSDNSKVSLFDLYLDGYDATDFGGIGGSGQTLTVDSTASKYTITASGGNSIEFAKGVLTEVDGSTTNELQTITLDSVSGTYNLSLSNGGGTVKIKRDTDTDDQTLSFSSPNLSISEGNTVDLSALQDGTGTDDQTLTIDSNATTYTLSIESGNNVKFAKGGGGGATPDGPSGAIQFNRGDTLAGSDTLKWAEGNLFVYGNGGTSTISIGAGASKSNTSGSNWTAIGSGAGGNNTSGIWWTAIGSNAGESNLTQSFWTAIGSQSGRGNTSGKDWTAIGYVAGRFNTSGSNWTSIGSSAGYRNVTGSDWTAIGTASSMDVTQGSNWTSIGSFAGRYVGTGTSNLLQRTDNSIYIGYRSRAGQDTVTNETVIAYDYPGNGNNTVTIGNSSVTDTYMGGTVHSSGAYVGKVTTFNASTGQTSFGDYICLVDYTTTGIATLTIDTDNLVNGYTMIIKDMDGNAGANTITINTEGAETIDGAASITITTNYGAVRLFSDGINWYTY